MDFFPFSLDPRDIVYIVAGLAFLGLTFQPALSAYRLANIPFFYVLVGALLAFAGIPAIDPNDGGLSAKVVEHAAELIVIISLAGAGLAIDTRESWRNWNPTFKLLMISMPLTILAVFLLGHLIIGLDWPSAMLLAAALAPTDPVLARSVQVGPPGRQEQPMEVALTAEAGLNDGLAFPFVYLAIAAATYAYAGDTFPEWIWGWFGYDLLYRVIAGWCIGYAIGHAISKVIYSRFGDAKQGGWNAMLVVLAATLISYGVTETFDAYGFLAVFAAARAGRANSRGTEKSKYEKYVHHGADQLESILLALMLLWFGMFIASGGLAGLTWMEVAIALTILLFVRPVSGYLSLFGNHCEDLQRFKVAFFGIRGMGTIFYIAYGQNHADFTQMETVWRVAAITILLSIIMHGFAAKFVLPAEEDEPDHPYRANDPDYQEQAK